MVQPREPRPAGDITTDTLLRGRVTLLQPARGFRSSLDPVLLGTFVKPPFGRFVDIGCGAGALAFVLAALDQSATGVGIEIQARLASLATLGLARNPFADRLAIIEADVRKAVGSPPLGRASFDLVATNPPYRVVNSGVPSPDPERAQANHEVTLTLEEWLSAAAALIALDGRLAAVYPAQRLPELIEGLRQRGLSPIRSRMVYPHEGGAPSRVLIEARVHGPPSPLVEPPLVLHKPGGGYTAEARRILGEPPVGSD